MTKMKYLNREQSKKIFQSGFVKYDYFEMCGFARWAKNCEGWSKDKIEKHIKSEFFKHGLNIVLLRDTIHKAVLSSRFDFLEQETVTISKTEIEKISNLKNRRWQKATFGILVFSKKFGIYNKNTLYFWQDIKEIVRKVGVYMNDKEYSEFLTYIGKEMNYITSVLRRDKLSWRISFASDDDVYCTVTDFSRVQDYLPTFCVSCGKITEKKKYCEEHRI